MDGQQDYNELNRKVATWLNSELKLRGVTQARVVEKLAVIGISEKKVNVANKLARGKFLGAFVFVCLSALKTDTLHLQ